MRHVETVMGIPMSVDLRNPPAGAAAAVRAAFDELHRQDRRFSPYRPDSEIERINRGELEVTHASPELRQVLERCAVLGARSGGAFRCRRPDGALDPSGLVKGWAVDRAAALLQAAGVTDFCFNAGGDVLVAGRPAAGLAWHVAIKDPRGPAPLAVLAVRDAAAVATSGRYERGDHIWDGRSGRPATGLASLSLVATDLATADALATAAFPLGARGVVWAVSAGAWAALGVAEDGSLLAAGAVRDFLAQPAAGGSCPVR